MKHGSLFSGIGGFDLAAEWMGWDNVFHCEWNDFGKKILNYYWPKAISYDDITKTDFTIHRGAIDILTGGFPCQPFSVAGKQKGTDDERHLWPEMLRAIREIQPRYVVGENVPGLVSWDGGMVFEQVQADLEAEGYEVTPFLLPASGVNAPHQRERIWFVAYSRNIGCDDRSYNREKRHLQTASERVVSENKSERNGREFGACTTCENKPDLDTNSTSPGLQKPGQTRKWEFSKEDRQRVDNRPEQLCRFDEYADCTGCEKRDVATIANESRFRGRRLVENWNNWPTQPSVCDGNDGISGRLDGITFPKWRNESIKAGGNAIVPQVVFQIFKAIEQYEKSLL